MVVTLLGLGIILIIYFGIKDHFEFKKMDKDLDKILKKMNRNDEVFDFLSSEAGQRSLEQVSSLCNELGIDMESDQNMEEYDGE